MEFSDRQIMGFVGQYLWPFIRVSAFFMVMPFIGSQLTSLRIRLVLAVMVSAVIAPVLPPLPTPDFISLEHMLLVAQQVLIGVAMGFVLQLTLQIFVLAGQMIAMQMGLGFAQMVDPANGISVTVLSQFYLMLATLLFVLINGHLMAIEVFVSSFYLLPVGGQPLPSANIYNIVLLGSWLFTSALSIALPIVIALLAVNMAFGVMSRSAPQLNVFALGFPMALLMGLLVIWLALKEFLPLFEQTLESAMWRMKAVSSPQ